MKYVCTLLFRFRYNTLNLATTAFSSNGERNHLTGNKYIFDGNLERKLLCGKKLNTKYITPTNWKLDSNNDALFTTDELFRKNASIYIFCDKKRILL